MTRVGAGGRPRRGPVAVTLLAAIPSLMGLGCTDETSSVGDGNPRRSAAGVEISLDARVTVDGDAVAVRYSATNAGEDPVLVLHHLSRPVGAGTRIDPGGWVALDAGDGVLEIGQRAIAPPDGVDLAAYESLGATELEPGATTDVVELRVPIPPEARGPYASVRPEPPDEARAVRFCLGAATEDDAVGRTARRGPGTPPGVDAMVAHSPLWAEAQAVTCTEPVDLP